MLDICQGMHLHLPLNEDGAKSTRGLPPGLEEWERFLLTDKSRGEPRGKIGDFDLHARSPLSA
jgi:hypothetical protein